MHSLSPSFLPSISLSSFLLPQSLLQSLFQHLRIQSDGSQKEVNQEERLHQGSNYADTLILNF